MSRTVTVPQVVGSVFRVQTTSSVPFGLKSLAIRSPGALPQALSCTETGSRSISAHSVATNPSRSLQFNVNGASSYGNDVRIDGMSQYNIWVPENVAYIPSSDAIQVVNVATNSFNPEQGLAGGSSINVQIKSGTNQLHGDVYEYHYDNGIEARPYFFYGRNPKDIFNQFGGSVGGPMMQALDSDEMPPPSPSSCRP